MNWEVSLIQLVSSKILVAVEEEKRKVTSRKRKSLKKKHKVLSIHRCFTDKGKRKFNSAFAGKNHILV